MARIGSSPGTGPSIRCSGRIVGSSFIANRPANADSSAGSPQCALTRHRDGACRFETLRLTRERKRFGVGAVLEDLQAQQELARARSDHLSAVADFNKAQYGLSKAV